MIEQRIVTIGDVLSLRPGFRKFWLFLVFFSGFSVILLYSFVRGLFELSWKPWLTVSALFSVGSADLRVLVGCNSSGRLIGFAFSNIGSKGLHRAE